MIGIFDLISDFSKEATLIHKEDNHMNREQVMVDFSSLALHLFNILNHDGKGIKLSKDLTTQTWPQPLSLVCLEQCFPLKSRILYFPIAHNTLCLPPPNSA